MCAAVLTLAVSPGFSQTKKTATAGNKKSGGKTAPASPVDLNDASESELESVPGIGAPTAKKIIAGRPYSSISDLSKAGLSAVSIKKITPNVTVGGSTPSSPTTVTRAAKTSPAATTSAKTVPSPSGAVAPGGGPGLVWVNTETKKYHLSNDKWYGKTKNGKYMKESDAIAAGYKASRE